MTAESEMRSVILHAADLLMEARDKTITCSASHSPDSPQYYSQPRSATTASALAEGVLRLLAAYLAVEDTPRLAVEDAPRVNAQADPRRDGHGRFAKVADPGDSA